jgi:hypothetical protein
MTAAGFPINRTAIDNARRQDARLAAFTTLTEVEDAFLRWALDRWPEANLMPLAGVGTAAADVIALEQEVARKRRADAMSRGVSAPSNASQGSPPYSRKDALRAVPQGGASPSSNALNENNNFNASYRQLKPTVVSPLRTVPIVRNGRGRGGPGVDAT